MDFGILLVEIFRLFKKSKLLLEFLLQSLFSNTNVNFKPIWIFVLKTASTPLIFDTFWSAQHFRASLVSFRKRAQITTVSYSQLLLMICYDSTAAKLQLKLSLCLSSLVVSPQMLKMRSVIPTHFSWHHQGEKTLKFEQKPIKTLQNRIKAIENRTKIGKPTNISKRANLSRLVPRFLRPSSEVLLYIQ